MWRDVVGDEIFASEGKKASEVEVKKMATEVVWLAKENGGLRSSGGDNEEVGGGW